MRKGHWNFLKKYSARKKSIFDRFRAFLAKNHKNPHLKVAEVGQNISKMGTINFPYLLRSSYEL